MKRSIFSTIFGLFVIFLLAWYVDQVAHKELVTAVIITIYVAAGAIVITLIAISVLFILTVRERVLKQRASRKQMERDAKVMYIVADEGKQVYIRDDEAKATWRNAHLDVRVYANGKYVSPNEGRT